MRLGVILSVLGVVALGAATAVIPLALRHPPQSRSLPVPVTTTIWSLPLNGGAPTLVARLRGQYASPVTGDRGSLLLVRPHLLGGADLVELRARKLRRVGRLSLFERPEWSPDRTRLATWGPTNRIDVVDRRGDRVRTLTRQRGEGGFTGQSWSGDLIAFVRLSHVPTWHQDLEVWHAGGALAWKRHLPYPDGAIELALAPDGRRVAEVAVHRLKLVTPTSTRVLAEDAQSWPPLWTPDGRLVYFDLRGRLLLHDPATQTRRVIARGRFGDASLSSDGRTLYVVGAKPAVSIPKYVGASYDRSSASKSSRTAP